MTELVQITKTLQIRKTIGFLNNCRLPFEAQGIRITGRHLRNLLWAGQDRHEVVLLKRLTCIKLARR